MVYVLFRYPDFFEKGLSISEKSGLQNPEQALPTINVGWACPTYEKIKRVLQL
ncbi:MAG: hypothetical protein NTW80_09705 [Deltaproteobacteria bacterium]|nr:hypothetical protein [Deltaproteobacteria bacterium]